MKILVIQQKMIGDVLTSSILFEALRKKYPLAQLHYLVYKHTVAVVENNPYIDRLVIFEEENKKTKAYFNFLKKIKEENYQVIIDAYSKLGTALISAASGAEKRISYRKWYTGFCYSHTVIRKDKPETSAGLAIENRMRLLKPVSEDFPQEIKPKIYLTSTEMEKAGKIISSAGISDDQLMFMISVLGSSPEKTYPYQYLAKLLDEIVEETGAILLFNYIPPQLTEAKKIVELCKPPTRERIRITVFGKSLREFMALTAHCDALIGNEGGAINMAKALNVPTFAIFSPAVSKADWSLYEDQENVSVHLYDYRPGFFQKYTKKEIKKRNSELYRNFSPDLVLPHLRQFLNLISKKKQDVNQ